MEAQSAPETRIFSPNVLAQGRGGDADAAVAAAAAAAAAAAITFALAAEPLRPILPQLRVVLHQL
jgi:hypothetical protein